jgi:hypothetical protein
MIGTRYAVRELSTRTYLGHFAPSSRVIARARGIAIRIQILLRKNKSAVRTSYRLIANAAAELRPLVPLSEKA